MEHGICHYSGGENWYAKWQGLIGGGLDGTIKTAQKRWGINYLRHTTIIINIYESNDIAILINNTEVHNIRNIKDSPLSEYAYYQIKEDYYNCRDTVNLSGQNYRQEENKYLKERLTYIKKMQIYYQKGMKDVAQFCSGLASRQTKVFKQTNSKAVTAFLDEHSNRVQDFNTLDLHFLYVKEALPSLDVFLGTNINLLRRSVTKT
ncbi:uncharacterized protein LOC143190843 [Rhynchophorus ferrugineus]|uniref:uncharacterized protein LOC143190843 n=1 Tax=Rhynchophorus ferrugineus TaxID=354439 RepID=UPI003FCD6F3E